MSDKKKEMTTIIRWELRAVCPNCKKNFSAKESDHNQVTFCPGCDQLLLQKMAGKD